MNLFTYGTLTFPEVWQRISICTGESQPATLAGYAIYRVQDANFPGIILADHEDCVSGVLYHDLDEETIFELDAYESQFYRRVPVVVTTDSGEQVNCETYIVPDTQRMMLTNEPWDAEWFAQRYLEKYLSGK